MPFKKYATVPSMYCSMVHILDGNRKHVEVKKNRFYKINLNFRLLSANADKQIKLPILLYTCTPIS